MLMAFLCACMTIEAQPSSFSLRNTHVTMPQGYNDFSLKNSGVVGSTSFGQFVNLGGGNWFKGSTSNGRPSIGTLHFSNGIEHKGALDENLRPHGVVLTTWPDGTWYYGGYVNGMREGEGSMCVNGTCYDVVMSNNEIESSVEVDIPRFSKSSFDGVATAANNAYSNSSSSSTSGSRSSSSSSKRRYTTSEINRQADVTARAYEEYKKNPTSSSHMYYISNKNMLDMMQGR